LFTEGLDQIRVSLDIDPATAALIQQGGVTDVEWVVRADIEVRRLLNPQQMKHVENKQIFAELGVGGPAKALVRVSHSGPSVCSLAVELPHHVVELFLNVDQTLADLGKDIRFAARFGIFHSVCWHWLALAVPICLKIHDRSQRRGR
jgi:hypothetical protein